MPARNFANTHTCTDQLHYQGSLLAHVEPSPCCLKPWLGCLGWVHWGSFGAASRKTGLEIKTELN
eukprot:3145163-Amphidinium_carterae.1